MFVSVRHVPIKKQTHKTSCWISAAHYTLCYLGLPDLPALKTLEDTHYAPDSESASSMTGAGSPEKLLTLYGTAHGYTVTTMKLDDHGDGEIIDAIFNAISNNVPVIAGIRSSQIHGFGHAIVITSINRSTGTIAYKDPANINSSNPFLTDIRVSSVKEFRDGFSYRYHNGLHTNIWAFCSRIITIQKG
ncbi:C39 family peptidase [Jeongeupia wiesaeckerbachi]|uniref:papain-like cysteine protease family protein n=1 Tax=Jeongeupia wiesaeckerbachi TaxID=3051218 RepID=UPI003D8037D5